MSGYWSDRGPLNGYILTDEEAMSKFGLVNWPATSSCRDFPRSMVVRCEEGKPVEVVGEDGGEPEDQTLGRNWSWVVPALNAAYARGQRDGQPCA